MAISHSLLAFIFSIFIFMSSFKHAYSLCLADQRSLLLHLKDEFTYDYSVSRKLISWNQSQDCCSWSGVECNGEGRVISLQLDEEAISGKLGKSSSLFALGYLEKLNLAYNYFYGIQIPSGIQNLTRLTHLNLSNSGFVGRLPNQLSVMTRLVSLDLSSSFLGIQPLVIDNPNLKALLQNLTQLKELLLDGVKISTQGNEWCQLISSSLHELQILSLRDCDLSGPLDPLLLQLHSLSILRLDMNNLSAIVPDSFANFSSLTTLTLKNCSLKGSFPEMIFHMPTLENLDLSGNELLMGTIPQFPQNTLSLRTIVLSLTNFSGSLPDSIVNLNRLTVIDLFHCNFTGPIPSSLGNLTELVYLELSGNSFIGPIPPFHRTEKLRYLDLSYNKLTGSLSCLHFKGLSNLVYMDLQHNFLVGKIPQCLFSLRSLQNLTLCNNNFNSIPGEFPTAHFSIIVELDLSSNQLQGSIPEWMYKLKRLEHLSLAFNLFNGTVVLEKFQGLRNLTILELSYNNFSVDARSSLGLLKLNRLNLASCNLHEFPDLRNQSNIVVLDLSSNQIKGEIPSWIWQIGNGSLAYVNLSSNLIVDLQKPYQFPTSLFYLDLHKNQLHGELPMPPPSALYVDYSYNHFDKPIPLDIGNFTLSLRLLSVAYNRLNGIIPESLCSAKLLEVLDLFGNNLTGNIPPCLVENTENFGVLNLGRNNINGYIPDIFPVKCLLHALNLNNNNLRGRIPPSLANCRSLQLMDVSENNIVDSFPCMLPSSLRIMVLRGNGFHGEVTCNNSSWPNLQIIDIASNRFSGNLRGEIFLSLAEMMLEQDPHPNPIGFRFQFPGNLYYIDSMKFTSKGNELEYVKILTYFTLIDFSCNNFQGEIPRTIGLTSLVALGSLNLSHNHFRGRIPPSFGNMKHLESLDLSDNQLEGEIPKELAGVTSLEVINLSHNQLVGIIPEGPQFKTFTANSFEGNSGLCGFPLSRRCKGSYEDTNGEQTQSRSRIKTEETHWEYVSAGLGFGVGFGSTVFLLLGSQYLSPKFSETVGNFLEYMFHSQEWKRRLGRGSQRREDSS